MIMKKFTQNNFAVFLAIVIKKNGYMVATLSTVISERR